MFKKLTALLVLTAAAALSAGQILFQDFEDTALFTPGASQLKQVGLSANLGGNWLGFNEKDFTIVPGASNAGGSQVLQISRVTPAVTLRGFRTIDLKAERETTLRIDLRPGSTDKCQFGFSLMNSFENKKVAQLNFINDNMILSIVGGHGNFVGRSIPNEWQTFEVIVRPGADKLECRVIDKTGKVHACVAAPMENNLPFNLVEFFNVPGSAESALVDRIEVSQADHRTVKGRENVALAAMDSTAAVEDANGSRECRRLIDGECGGDGLEQVPGFPATATITLGEPRTVSTVRIFSGFAGYLPFPSGDQSLTACRIEGLSTASGGWRELVTASEGAPVATDKEEDDAQRCWQFDFDPIEVRAVRVTLLASNDTGKRSSGPVEINETILREIEVYDKAFGSGAVGLGSVLQAEFRVPVYRYQAKAELYAILAEGTEPFEVEVSARERWNGTVPMEPFRVRLVPGENIIPVDITGWENGEYRTQLRAAGKDAPVRGDLARLLRLDRLPPNEPPAVFEGMSGKKMYFPDGWYLDKQAGLDFKQFKPEVHYLDLPRVHDPDAYVKLGSTMYFTDDGKIVISYSEYTYEFNKYVGKCYASCTPGEWKWELLDGEPKNIVATNNSELNALQCRPAVGDSLPNGSVGNMGTFRIYDPEKDGPVDLSQVIVQYVGYKPLDWGVVKVPPQSTWLLWKKGPKEYILLWDHPFLQDNLSGDEFEALTDTNDNHAGQWLSQDGKTLTFVRGHLLKRYPPFVGRYDNLWQAARILTVFSTQDGINWTRHYYALPDETDPVTEQHYGAGIYWAPQGNNLMFAHLDPYNAVTQQYDVEMVWSWGGLEWKRFPGHERWLKAGEPDQPSFGITNMHNNILEKDGLVYHEIGWATPVPHFAYEGMQVQTGRKLTGEDLRKTYEKRGVAENWPFFTYYGSWDKLAESWNTVTSTCGVAVYRKNGIFGMAVGKDGGSFTTRPMTARGKLTANIKVLPGGKAHFRLLSADGKELAAADLTGDGVALPLFDELPAGQFRIAADLANVELYTLNFD